MPTYIPDPTPIYGYTEEIAMTETVERIVLASRPVGEPTLDNFRLEELPIPQPGPGQMLLRTLWLSLNPYMRGRIGSLTWILPTVHSSGRVSTITAVAA